MVAALVFSDRYAAAIDAEDYPGVPGAIGVLFAILASILAGPSAGIFVGAGGGFIFSILVIPHHSYLQQGFVVCLWAGTAYLSGSVTRMALDLAAQSEALKAAIVDNALDAILTFDGDGALIDANQAAEEMFGWPCKEIVGTQFANEFLEAGDQERLYQAIHKADENPSVKRQHMKMKARRRDGLVFPIDAAVVRLPGPERLFTAFILDVSVDRQLEMERELLQEQLLFSSLEQAALSKVATAVATTEDPGSIFPLVANEIATLFRARTSGLMRFDRVDRVVMLGLWTENGREVPWGKVHLDDDWSAVARAYQVGHAVMVDYRKADTGFGKLAADDGFECGVAAPIKISNRRWGALAIAGDVDKMPDNAPERLQRFADLVGISIENAEVRSQLLARASTDPLTGLANHRTFQERLRDEFELAKRHHRNLSLVMFDLDDFKEVNDSFGHQVGDMVISEIARRLTSVVRTGELLARIGGDEFSLLLPHVDADAAMKGAERARSAVADHPIGSVGRLTMSAGVCDLARANTVDELVRLADGALYWAKAVGANKTVMYDPAVVEALSAEERTEAISRAQTLASIRALARAVDAKDHSTAEHSMRVANLASLIAKKSGWTSEECERLREAAYVHDVGKIGIPDALLFKPSRLTDEEYGVIKRHSEFGAEIVGDVLKQDQISWIRGHHERWDGRGYPDKLDNSRIPEGARILAIADAWDVMTNVRIYRDPLPMEVALEEVRKQSGQQFCPYASAALLNLAEAGGLEYIRETTINGTSEDK